MAVVETHNLTKRFGQQTAVDRLTLAVETGEVFGLLGPNGAGKSTVIKMLTTLIPATTGAARVAGFDVSRDRTTVQRLIGYVPQALSVDGTLTGYENLLVVAKLYNVPRAKRLSRVRSALSYVGLADVADRLVRTYSGGMIRRLEIAQALLHHPRVLFMDEPTVGLDPVARKAMWELVQQLRADYGTTIFLTTHFMDEADTLCDRVAIMHLGQVVVTGTPQELKTSVKEQDASLDDVFIHYTGDYLAAAGDYRDTSATRRTAQRLG
ncbi:ATP-binding cassette domain-containing protein [Oculatella sp. LEGE 06141]|uniref:ATP-binding cassette domain-containing protein n=1 Tax=Oculatella sp. LEGE 06141 TaxID=1828648 RepID=UPI001881F171|nr:ATP-binding cassette domain-containing protein [Oculatella sp. LEGE 06141]MBE9180929.1 ATP-binding cassette domain-containing protein [Oculatella sp. LEGE 06141]